MVSPDHSLARRNDVPAFIVVELTFLAVAHGLGGPPWVALGVATCIAQVFADFRLGPLLGIVPALGWVAAAHATGNRELFFPYAMFLAAHVASQFGARGRWAAAIAGAGLVAMFLGIRVLQHAPASVLAVELAVAAAILAAVVFVVMKAAQRTPGTVAVAAVASFAAYAGLAL